MLFKDWIFFFFLYIYKGTCILKHTHTKASRHSHTHTVHDQVASVVRKWEGLSVKRRNDVGSVRPAYTQKLIGKTFIGKNYSKPLPSFSSQALNEKACGEILWSEFCREKDSALKWLVHWLMTTEIPQPWRETTYYQYCDIIQLL